MSLRAKRADADNIGGYIVVETLVCLTALMMVMVLVISLINVVMIKARIHYALTQTALEMSMYAYTTAVIAEDDELFISNPGDIGWVTAARSGIDSASNWAEDVGESLAATVAGWFVDKYAAEFMRALSAADTEAARQAVLDDAVRGTFAKYLCNDLDQAETQAAAFLTKAGIFAPDSAVQGLGALDFSFTEETKSTMVNSAGDTVVSVAYRIKYNVFNIMPLPLYLNVQQTATTKAWLKGATVPYTPEPSHGGGGRR